MRRGRTALWLLLGLAGAAGAQEAKPSASPAPSPSAATPRIAVEPAGYDFGTVLQEKTLHKEFSLRNFGRGDLVVESVSTTCGCTVGQLETKLIKPGATVPLRVSLETRNYSGTVRRSVLIRSNDPAKGLLEIKLEANVQPAPVK